MFAIVTNPVVKDYLQQTQTFLWELQDICIQEKPMVNKFNVAWFNTDRELRYNISDNMETSYIYTAFQNCNYYIKNLHDVRRFLHLLRPDMEDTLHKNFGTKEAKETLGFSGSGQHAYIKYLAKAMFCFMKNYYGEKDYLDQIYRLWGIFK